MLTLTTLLRATRQKAEYGELSVPIPRDHAPAAYYAELRHGEASRVAPPDDGGDPEPQRADRVPEDQSPGA